MEVEGDGASKRGRGKENDDRVKTPPFVALFLFNLLFPLFFYNYYHFNPK